MKRFHFAIKAIESEIFRHVGKVVMEASNNNINDMMIETRSSKIKNLKRAIEILNNHEDNKNV